MNKDTEALVAKLKGAKTILDGFNEIARKSDLKGISFEMVVADIYVLNQIAMTSLECDLRMLEQKGSEDNRRSNDNSDRVGNATPDGTKNG